MFPPGAVAAGSHAALRSYRSRGGLADELATAATCDNAGVRASILLIRHAATDPGSRLCGSFDLPLSPAGEAEVATLTAAPGAPPADVLYSSPLRRARLVAE